MDADRGRERYTTGAIVLHWAIAGLLVFQVALGFRMGAASGAAEFALFQLHKSIGITMLLLVAIRLLWRLTHRPPPIHAQAWEKALAHATHGLLYALMLLLPLSGWVIISTSRIVVPTLLFGTVPWPHLPVPKAWNAAADFVHGNLAWVLIALFLLHVAGALKHHLVDRDGELDRMVPGVRTGRWSDPRLLAVAAGVMLAAGMGWRWLPIGGRAVAAPAPPPAAAPVRDEPDPVPTPAPSATPSPIPTPSATPTPAMEVQPLASWRIGKTSTLRFSTSWSGGAIAGGFRRFAGDIRFSPDDLAHSRAAITIDLASVYSGDEQRDETLKSGDWFAVGSAGSATFTADSFRHLSGDRYVASGTLRIKGRSLPSTVRFTLRIAGDSARMRGSATVNRTAYRIGEGEYESTDDIPADVAVAIAVDATRMK